MSISPFSYRDLGSSEVAVVSTGGAAPPKEFLPHNRKKKEEAPPPPPPPPTFSEEQIQAAERDSYQKGFLDGIVEGKKQAENIQAQIDQKLSESVAQWSTHYAPLFSVYREMLTHQAKLLPQMAHAIAQKVAVDALSANAYQSVETIALRCLQTLTHEPKLVITLHESMKETLEAKLKTLPSAQAMGEILVVGDPHIAPPNCRIEWKNGSMVRDVDALWQQVEDIVNSMITSSDLEVDALCNALSTSKGEE